MNKQKPKEKRIKCHWKQFALASEGRGATAPSETFKAGNLWWTRSSRGSGRPAHKRDQPSAKIHPQKPTVFTGRI